MWNLVAKYLPSGRKKPAERDATVAAPMPSTRPVRPEWERALTASLDQNCAAPSDDTVLHAYDLYCDVLYAPFLERQHQMADLHAEISADVAALQARAPHLIERAMSRHPFEYAHILEHKEML